VGDGDKGELDNGDIGGMMDLTKKEKERRLHNQHYIITFSQSPTGHELQSYTNPISLPSTTFFAFLVSSTSTIEHGQLKLDFASLELGTRLCVVQGFDFASTPGF
jgi:hypothetical protein